MKRLPILFSLLALVVLSASIAYWILQLYQPPQRPLAAVPQASLPEPGIDAAATLFGGQAAASVATNYQLTGVIAAGGQSVAIIVAEGTPPKALKVGKELSPGVTISEVHPRYVMLSDNGVMKRIDMAADTKAAAPMSAPGAMQGAAPEGEPQTSAGALQQPVETPVQEAPPVTPPAPPAPAPMPVQQLPQPVSPGAVPGTVPGGTQAPPPPAPVQMPPPVRSPASPVPQAPTTR